MEMRWIENSELNLWRASIQPICHHYQVHDCFYACRRLQKGFVFSTIARGIDLLRKIWA